MAKIEKTIEKVPTYIEETHYQLTLTPAEAECLAAVCARIGGKPEGVRSNMTKIGEALRSVGFEGVRLANEPKYNVKLHSSSISFDD